MNVFVIFILLAITILVASKTHGAEVYDAINSAVSWLAGTLVFGALLGSSVAVVFNYGEEKLQTVKRALISFIFSISTTPFVVDYLGLSGSFPAQWFFSFITGVLGFVIIEVLYSQSVRKSIQAALTRGRSK